MTGKRSLQIDALKGFAILLVVLGHSIQMNNTDFDNNILFRIIYSFHMPLFMFLSGYIAWNRVPVEKAKWLVKKFKTLVIPFICWYLVGYFLTGSYKSVDIADYIIRVIKSPDNGLWFLWILFLNYCVLVIGLKSETIFGSYALLIAVLVTQFIPAKILGIHLLKWHICFFIMGYLTARYKQQLEQRKTQLGILSLIGFPMLVTVWKRNEKPLFIPYLSEFINMGVGYGIIERIYNYLVPILGIIMIYFMVKRLARFRFYKVLCWLGTVTIDIYVSHQLFLSRPEIRFGSGLVRYISAGIFALGLSILLSFIILRQSKILGFLFLGTPTGTLTSPWINFVDMIFPGNAEVAATKIDEQDG